MKANQLDMVDLLVDSGVDIENQDGEGSTPLLLAMNMRDHNMVVHLLKKGGSPSHVDAFRVPADPVFTACKIQHYVIHWAVEENQPEIVDLSLDSGVDIESQDAHGLTPLQLAMRMLNPSMVVHLLKRGASPFCVGWPWEGRMLGLSPSYLTELISVMIQASEIIKDPVAAACFLNIQDQCGDTALHAALSMGCTHLAERPVHHGASLSVQNVLGQTPLWAGLRANRLTSEDVAALVRAGAPLDAIDRQGQSLLGCAVMSGVCDLTLLLAGARAFLHVAARRARHTAKHRRKPLSSTYLSSGGMKLTPYRSRVEDPAQISLSRKVLSGIENIVKYMWSANTEQNIAIFKCLAGLHSLGEREGKSTLCLLLEAGVRLPKHHEDVLSGFCMSTYVKHREIVRVLLNAGASWSGLQCHQCDLWASDEVITLLSSLLLSEVTIQFQQHRFAGVPCDDSDEPPPPPLPSRLQRAVMAMVPATGQSFESTEARLLLLEHGQSLELALDWHHFFEM